MQPIFLISGWNAADLWAAHSVLSLPETHQTPCHPYTSASLTGGSGFVYLCLSLSFPYERHIRPCVIPIVLHLSGGSVFVSLSVLSLHETHQTTHLSLEGIGTPWVCAQESTNCLLDT